MTLVGVRLIGFTAESGRKVLISIAIIVIALIAHRLLRVATDAILHTERLRRARFRVRHVRLVTATVVVGREDAMSRDILAGLEQRGIRIASAALEIAGLPTRQIAPAKETH